MKKGYKVSDVSRVKKIGVAAENLAELIEKSCKKLNFSASCAECRLFVAEDGTQVDDDDYLKTLPSQTLFILLKDKEEMVTDFDYYYNLIRSTKKEYIETGTAAKDFLTTNIKDKFKVFQKYIIATEESNAALSDRAQDPEWFEGLEPSEKTKELSMSKRGKERMRGYFYKTKTALKSSDLYVHSKNGHSKVLVDQFLLGLQKLLDLNKFNQSYFNRKAIGCICNKMGLFECEGLWSRSKCIYEGEHAINPYRCREERIIFQTWNLDHKIEISRSIIPNILKTINELVNGRAHCHTCHTRDNSGSIDINKFYSEIFTRANLKLVHIVCHYKGKHDIDSDIYILCQKCKKKSKVIT